MRCPTWGSCANAKVTEKGPSNGTAGRRSRQPTRERHLRILLGEHRSGSPSGHGIAGSDYGGGHYALGFNF